MYGTSVTRSTPRTQCIVLDYSIFRANWPHDNNVCVRAPLRKRIANTTS